MTSSTTSEAPSVAIVGLGLQGTEIARLLLDTGYRISGAVDPGHRKGQPISDFVSHDAAPETIVDGSITELVSTNGAPDVGIIAASVDAETVTDLAIELIRAGSAVITTNGELFGGEGPLIERIDEEAKKAGVAFTATGVQDLLYLRLPLLLAGATHNLRQVRIETRVGVDSFSIESAQQDSGLGLSEEEFGQWKTELLSRPSILGGPLRLIAKELGLTPGEQQNDLVAVYSPHTLHWKTAGRDLEPGTIVGSEVRTSFGTAEGVHFEGTLRWKLNEGEEEGNFYRIVGDTQVEGSMRDSDTHFLLTDVAIARRVPDVLAAAPGAHVLSDFGPLRYQHPVARTMSA